MNTPDSLRPRLLRLARSILLRREDAEDAVQDALIRAETTSHVCRGDPLRWMLTVTANQCRDIIRQIRPLDSLQPDHLGRIADPSPSPHDHALQAELAAVVREAVESLPAHQRACVVLYYFEDLPLAEIADRLGVAEGTVKSRLARAREALHQRLVGYIRMEVTSE
jgi:RNA polymerase sigma-70 factor, ECF subfamily